MTVKELAKKTGFSLLTGKDSLENTAQHIYTCDLLSLVMGRAQQNDVWITVMGNVNSIAVAVLADVACIILAEGMTLDAEATKKAAEQDVAVLLSPLAVYETAQRVAQYL